MGGGAMATEKIWSLSNTPTPSDGDRNFLIVQKWEEGVFFKNDSTHSHPFWLLKDFNCHPMVEYVGWRPKKFGYHLRNHHCLMVTKTLRSPRKTGMSYFLEIEIFQLLQFFYHHRVGDWIFFIIIRFSNRKVLVATRFGNRIHHRLWQLKKILVTTRYDNQKFLVATRFGD
jgi:hypothetical protein